MRPLRYALLSVAALLALASCTQENPGLDESTTDVIDDPAGEASGPTYAPLGEPGAKQYDVHLEPLNDSGVSGFATIEVDDDGMTVTVESTGFEDDLAHAQHLHARGEGRCPEPAAVGDDDLIDSEEGVAVYGAPLISLTTEGDLGADSQFDLDRFPTAIGGAVGYSRTFDIPAPLQLSDLEDAVVVQHGRHTLDGPSEDAATIPVSCGALVPAEDDES